MKPITIALIILVSFLFAKDIFSQGLLKDENYKFQITLPSDWSVSITEESKKKNAISYTIYKNDSVNSLTILAVRVGNVKELDDWIFTLEKDVKLKIPKRDSDYTNFDHDLYDGRWAVYKDSEIVVTIYYYRTKKRDSDENYTYMLRFITASSYHNSDVEKEIQDIEKTFAPTL